MALDNGIRFDELNLDGDFESDGVYNEESVTDEPIKKGHDASSSSIFDTVILSGLTSDTLPLDSRERLKQAANQLRRYIDNVTEVYLEALEDYELRSNKIENNELDILKKESMDPIPLRVIGPETKRVYVSIPKSCTDFFDKGNYNPKKTNPHTIRPILEQVDNLESLIEHMKSKERKYEQTPKDKFKIDCLKVATRLRVVRENVEETLDYAQKVLGFVEYGKEDPVNSPTGDEFANFALGFAKPKIPQKSPLFQPDGL